MSQFQGSPYNVEKPTGTCALSGRELTPGEPYIATLVEATGEDGGAIGLKRLDIALEAWREGSRPEGLFSFWKTTVPQPKEKKKLFADNAVLLNLLHRLADETQQQRLDLRFVLCLILLRKKILRHDATEQHRDAEGNANEWWRLTPKLDPSKGAMGKWDEQNPVTVYNPGLSEERIQAVAEQLHEVLEGDL